MVIANGWNATDREERTDYQRRDRSPDLGESGEIAEIYLHVIGHVSILNISRATVTVVEPIYKGG